MRPPDFDQGAQRQRLKDVEEAKIVFLVVDIMVTIYLLVVAWSTGDWITYGVVLLMNAVLARSLRVQTRILKEEMDAVKAFCLDTLRYHER